MGVRVSPEEVDFNKGLYNHFTLVRVPNEGYSGTEGKVITFIKGKFPIVHSEILKEDFEKDPFIYLPKFLWEKLACNGKIPIQDEKSAKAFAMFGFKYNYATDIHFDYHFVAENKSISSEA